MSRSSSTQSWPSTDPAEGGGDGTPPRTSALAAGLLSSGSRFGGRADAGRGPLNASSTAKRRTPCLPSCSRLWGKAGGRSASSRAREVIMAPAHLRGSRTSRGSGGGGNRTRVRGRTGKSIYKLVLRLDFARRPVRRRPTDGLAILWSPASGDWLSLGSEPVS
jgi:hypothetical protein